MNNAMNKWVLSLSDTNKRIILWVHPMYDKLLEILPATNYSQILRDSGAEVIWLPNLSTSVNNPYFHPILK